MKKNKNRYCLPSAMWMALGETGFAECRLQALGKVKSSPSASLAALGKANVRQPAIRKADSGRACWTRVLPLPSAVPAALGKDQ